MEDALSELSARDRDELSRLLLIVKSSLSEMADSDPAQEIDWSDDDVEAEDPQTTQAL